MTNQLSELRNRLRIKKYSQLVNMYVWENFGYCPNGNVHFDKVSDLLRVELEIARENYPKLYEYYLDHQTVN